MNLTLDSLWFKDELDTGLIMVQVWTSEIKIMSNKVYDNQIYWIYDGQTYTLVKRIVTNVY